MGSWAYLKRLKVIFTTQINVSRRIDYFCLSLLVFPSHPTLQTTEYVPGDCSTFADCNSNSNRSTYFLQKSYDLMIMKPTIAWMCSSIYCFRFQSMYRQFKGSYSFVPPVHQAFADVRDFQLRLSIFTIYIEPSHIIMPAPARSTSWYFPH